MNNFYSEKTEKRKSTIFFKIIIILITITSINCSIDDNETNGGKIDRSDDAIKITDGSPQSSQNPVFSPDDKYILFTRFKNGYNIGPSEIVKINIDSKQETIIVPANDSDNVNVPYGSWVDNKICFSSDRGGGADEIWTGNDDGSNLKQITHHSESNEVYYIEPVFNPQNTDQIVFEYVTGEDDSKAKHQLAYLNAVTGNVTLITDTAFDYRLPSWSSDGKKVLYQRNDYGKDEGWDIYTSDITVSAGIKLSNARKISQTGSDDTDCSWCFDNVNVLSSSNYGNIPCPNIFMFSTNTSISPARKTSDNNNEDGAPSQSHDGNWIAFESHNGEEEDYPSEIWIIKSN